MKNGNCHSFSPDHASACISVHILFCFFVFSGGLLWGIVVLCPWPQRLEVETSRNVVQHNRSIVMGDGVLVRDIDDSLYVGKVWFHCSVNGRCYSCIARWRVVERNDNYMKVHIGDDEPELVDTQSLEESLIYSKATSTSCVSTVLLPPHLR